MRRYLVVLMLLTACQVMTPLPATSTVSPTVFLSPSPTVLVSTATLEPTMTVMAVSPTPTIIPTASQDAFPVFFHPDGALYVGDLVSLEVIQPTDHATPGSEVQVELPGAFQSVVKKAFFSPFGIAGRQQATFFWVWDTRQLAAGIYGLKFKVLPEGPEWLEWVELLPAEVRPKADTTAFWEKAASQCCEVFFISGTAAARDIDALLELMDAQAVDAAVRMNIHFDQPLQVVLLPRVLGHGGFANQDIHISYLDRNYTAGNTGIILHHEMVHVLDSLLNGGDRPSILIEGLAVYMTGGHFKHEPLLPRAATLLDEWGQPSEKGLGWYIPLETLAVDFYHAQHEIGYLEAGALVNYMVERWGWEEFSNFYRDIHFDPQGTQAQAIHNALVAHFGLSLADLDKDFQAALRQFPEDETVKNDVQLSVNFFDTVRRYQQAMDPSAYFSTAWLVDTGYMREQGIVADYFRRPVSLEHLVMETMLVSAGNLLWMQEFDQVKNHLAAINFMLGAHDRGEVNAFQETKLSRDYYQVIQAVYRAAWVFNFQDNPNLQVERVELEGDESKAWVSYGDPDLLILHLVRYQGNWIVEDSSDEMQVDCRACLTTP